MLIDWLLFYGASAHRGYMVPIFIHVASLEHKDRNDNLHMSLVTRKPGSGVCDQGRRKTACAATETS